LAEGRPGGGPPDQGDRLAGNHWRRHGASDGAAQRRLRPGEVQRLRLRHGGGAHRDAALRHRRHPPVFGQRFGVPGTVLIVVWSFWSAVCSTALVLLALLPAVTITKIQSGATHRTPKTKAAANRRTPKIAATAGIRGTVETMKVPLSWLRDYVE